MEKASSILNNEEVIISKDIDSQSLFRITDVFKSVGLSPTIPSEYASKDFYSHLIRSLLSIHQIQRGRLSCLLTVKPVVTNFYGGMHGGAVAAVAEMLSIACARTVVGKDKDIFLGELSMSYLSAAPCNAVLIADASVVRSGRNLTVIAVEFRLKESGRLTYTSRATFYNMPLSSL